MIKAYNAKPWEVQAILDGRKTCTRRLVKGYIPKNAQFGYTAFTPFGTISCRGLFETPGRPGYGEKFFKLPYQPGDILYVRETLYKSPSRYMYRADYSDTEKFFQDGKEVNIKWRPSIHMPKEAARIWLKVTDVRVERLQKIDEDGVAKEGLEPRFKVKDKFSGDIARGRFLELWNSTIKKSDLDRYGWYANPYVFVIEFERCEKPEGV